MLYTSYPEILKQLLLRMCTHDSIFRGARDKHFRWLKCVDDSRVPFFHRAQSSLEDDCTYTCIIIRRVCTNERTLESVRWINHARTQPRKIKTRFDEDLLNFESFNKRTRQRFFRVGEKERERSYHIPISFFIFGQWCKQIVGFLFSKWIGMMRNHRQRAPTINVVVKSYLMQEAILQIGEWLDAHARYETRRLARASLAISID